MGKSCNECKYYVALPEPQCRIRAPKAFMYQMQSHGQVEIKVVALFPPTKPETWCGEFVAAGSAIAL